MAKSITLFILLFTSVFLFAQDDVQEWLSELNDLSTPDTQKVHLLRQISDSYSRSDATQALAYGRKTLALAQKINFQEGLQLAFENMGNIYTTSAQYDSALFYLNKSNVIITKNNLSGLRTYNQIGNVYFYQSDYDKALEWYLKTLELSKAEGDSSAMARCYGNLGNVYYYQGDLEKVKTNFGKSLAIKESLKDSTGIAHTMGNMGNLYMDDGDMDSAFYFFNTAKLIFERQNNLFGMSLCLTSIADIYTETGELQKAEIALKSSINYCEMIGDEHGLMRNNQQLAAIIYLRGKHNEAIKIYLNSIEIAKHINAKEYIKDGYLNVSKIQEDKGLYKDALASYKLYYSWNDSISNEKKNEYIATLLTEYKTKEIEDSLHISQQNEDIALIKAEKSENDKKLAQLESEKKNRLLLIAIGALILFAALIILVMRNAQQRKKANILLESRNAEILHQKEIIEEKHAEITDSITYAKRIQNAILPPNRIVKEYLKDSFILYKPKDVVAGDFYWMENKITKDGEAIILFAAADCTGHGVPGAMVSVICNNGLNRSVREHNLIDPGEILNKTREIVIQEFEKSDDDVKDGMDISLCALQKNQLLWAGANNPLWIIRNGEILETKADKQPIGKYGEAKSFTTHHINLQKNDTIYIFTDGLQDQFGGEKGKKFKASNFKSLLISIQSENLERQRILIDEAFEKWRGELEQVDDICIIGVRI